MIQLSKSGNTVTFTFDENSGYLQNGTIDVPVNSLSLILDESNMATFRKSASNDIFVSALVGDFGMSKSELEAWYKENMVGSTGGGGGDITSGEVQTMIDESISGKADTSAVTQSINAAVSGKADTTAVTADISAAVSGKQDTLIEGRAIYITNNTVSLDLPISAGTGTNSIREGHSGNTASGNYSHAEGRQTSATSSYSHAEGYSTSADGYNSHAEGSMTRASGGYGAHAEGANTLASGSSSHAEGGFTVADGIFSHAEGQGTIANNQSEHASGQYNVSSSASVTFGNSGNTLFSVGNGSNENARHNAFEIRQNGDIYLTKDGQDVKLQDQLGGGISSGEVQTMIDSSISGKVDTSVFTAYTASTESRLAEDEEVTAAGINAVNDKFGGLSLVKLTQAQYDALAVKDNNVLYIIIN